MGSFSNSVLGNELADASVLFNLKRRTTRSGGQLSFSTLDYYTINAPRNHHKTFLEKGSAESAAAKGSKGRGEMRT